MNSQMKQLEAQILIWNIITSEPVTAVIVMERTSGLSSGVVSQAIQYK